MYHADVISKILFSSLIVETSWWFLKLVNFH